MNWFITAAMLATIASQEDVPRAPKDGWDIALVCLTAALVLVGAFQILFLWRTVAATRDNAKAAMLTAQAAVDSEKAWVMLEPNAPDALWIMFTRGGGQLSRMPSKEIPQLTVSFKNCGRTPGWVTEATAKFSVMDGPLPSALDYGEPTILKYGQPMVPGAVTIVAEVNLEPNHSLTQSDIYSIESGDRALILYGFVKYRDIFFENTKTVRETHFCLRYKVPPLSTTGETSYWAYHGPPEANRNT